jgi:hypothetical protein
MILILYILRYLYVRDKSDFAPSYRQSNAKNSHPNASMPIENEEIGEAGRSNIAG